MKTLRLRLRIYIVQHCYFLIGFLLTLSLLWPLVYASYFSMHDDVQTIRLYEMNKCIKDFQIPCRWVPDLGGEYGYPLFNYYGPLPYYIGEIFYLLSNSLIFSAKVMFAISFVGAFIFMYLCGRKLWGEMGGVVSAVFYSYAPYHSADFYVRGAMGEMWALMFYPAIFWLALRLREKVSANNFIYLGLSVAGLMLSHNLSTLIFMPFVGLLALVIYLKDRKLAFLLAFVGAVILGMTLAAFYWIPAYYEKSFAHLETTVEGYFSYTEHFKGLKKLFVERYWGYGASQREIPGQQADMDFPYQIGWMHVVVWMLSLIVAVLLWKKKRFASFIIFFSTFGITVSVFMINPKSLFVWQMIDQLKYLQFPWRFLMLVIFFISLIAGSLMFLVKQAHPSIKNIYKYALFVALLIGVVVLNFGYFRPQQFYNINDQYLLTGHEWDTLIKRSIFDFLPIYAKLPPAELATKRYEVLSGDAKISNFQEGSDWIDFTVTTKKTSTIRLSQYYFPDWVIDVDGQYTHIDYNNFLGLMTFTINPGVHEIQAHLTNTPVRDFSNLLTVLGIICIAIIIFRNKLAKILTFY